MQLKAIEERRVLTSIVSNEKRNHFLQTMLKHTAGLQIATSMPSEPIAPEILQGAIPLHQDSAIASLSPVLTNLTATTDSNTQDPFTQEGSTPAYKALENMSRKSITPRRVLRPSKENIAAEPLLRYLVQKADENHKMREQSWAGSVQGAY